MTDALADYYGDDPRKVEPVRIPEHEGDIGPCPGFRSARILIAANGRPWLSWINRFGRRHDTCGVEHMGP